MVHAVWHEVVGLDVHHSQTAERNGAGRGSVAVVVGDDGHAFAALPGECESLSRLAGAFEHEGRQHRLPVLSQFGGILDAARGKRAGYGRQIAFFVKASGRFKIEFAIEYAGHRAAPS